MLRTRLLNQNEILSVNTKQGLKFLLFFVLLSLSISANAQSVLVQRTISNTNHCSNGNSYGAWLNFSGINQYYTLEDGIFTEYDDNSAYFTGRLINRGDTTIQFNTEVIITGRTFHTPADSPKNSHCGNDDTSDWYYYTSTSGTLTGLQKAEGALITFDRMGPSFQAGTGANVTEGDPTFSACGWLNVTVNTQPTDKTLVLDGINGDFNFNLSGAPLTENKNTCSIGNRVWEDLNANGIQDEGEPGLRGVFIFLEDTEGNLLPDYDYALSDTAGFYAFTALPCDTFVVRFATPSGYYLTSGDQGDDELDSDASYLDGRSPVLYLEQNQNITNLDAGYYLRGSMIGRIWIDENANGQEGSEDTGVMEVMAKLYHAGDDQLPNTSDDIFIGETATDNAGYFEFFNLNPGFYFIQVDATTLPIGYNLIFPGQGSENFDSDLDQSTASSPVFEVTSGKNVSSVADGGLEMTCSFIPSARIGDATCPNFPVEFFATPNDEEEYTYLWEFFDDAAASTRLGESTKANTNFTWNSAGEKAYTLTVTDKDHCAVSFTQKLTILEETNSDCLTNLPVELLHFGARLQANKTTFIEWSTAWEESNSFFEVQRSYDGTRFENIGVVNGNGTTEQINRYDFTDETPYFGRTYYRLKQVDFDGTINFSEVVSVLIDSEVNADLIAQPNPTRGNLTLRLVSPFSEDATVEIVGPTGQVLDTQVIPSGAHTHEINLEKYQAGFYLLNINYNGFQKMVHRVLKIKD